MLRYFNDVITLAWTASLTTVTEEWLMVINGYAHLWVLAGLEGWEGSNCYYILKTTDAILIGATNPYFPTFIYIYQHSDNFDLSKLLDKFYKYNNYL